MNQISHEQKMLNRLTAKVEAQNQLGLLINEWQPKIRAVIEKWVGQKVSLITGGKPVKLKVELDALNMPSDWRKQIIVSFGQHSAKVDFRISHFIEGKEGANASVEGACYLGDMSGLILKDLHYEFVPWKTDYTVAAIQAARVTYKDAQKLADTAKSALYPFGEHDNN